MKSKTRPLVTHYTDPRLFDVFIEDNETHLVSRYYSPELHPDQWKLYLDSAEKSYDRYGVKCAVRRADLEKDPCPSFWMIEDIQSGELLGGMRNHGPYKTLDSIWALQEMKAHPKVHELEIALAPMIPKIIMENKGVFLNIGIEPRRSTHVIDMLLRLQAVSIDLLGAYALVGTSAQHTMGMWQRAGCEIICPHISVHYPNSHYDTRIVANFRETRHQKMEPKLRRAAERDFLFVKKCITALEAV